MSIRNQFTPPTDHKAYLHQFGFDISVLRVLLETWYLQPRYPVPKCENLYTLAWLMLETCGIINTLWICFVLLQRFSTLSLLLSRITRSFITTQTFRNCPLSHYLTRF
ncbi:hypothetical protein BDP27DRAFT_1503064 [Rhodocollybia butyracea]|uniref:Uncharacterized protein n=1 Tax=Rhodocollybia butyracea TaxID=206335 RepID=A0A9P5TYA8_9AGAR|nr:hypothetical protein BDP27DRAFT_1503064 [Rhodocollybia butyracea]